MLPPSQMAFSELKTFHKVVLPMPLTGDKQIYSRYRSLVRGKQTDRGVNKAVRGKRWFTEPALSLNIPLNNMNLGRLIRGMFLL